jgi:hypothetical protein
MDRHCRQRATAAWPLSISAKVEKCPQAGKDLPAIAFAAGSRLYSLTAPVMADT